MIEFLEVIDRAMNGRHCVEKSFDMEVFVPKVREVVAKYDIKFDPENPVCSDDALADRVFEAGFELFRDTGCYCPDSERILQFSEDELREALADAPRETSLGEGDDAGVLRARKPESDAPPWCFIGAGGAVVSNEELYSDLVEAYARNLPLANSLTCPTLAALGGRSVTTGSPTEIIAAIEVTKRARAALAKGGRPGLPIMNSIATAGSDTAKIAGSQFGLRPSDAWLIGATSELKFELQRFNEIAFVQAFGGHVNAETAPILGGYCGGPEGVAVTNVAYHLAAILVLRGHSQLTFPIHYLYGCTTPRDVTWSVSVSTQAISRNSHFPFFILSYTAAGPMTEMCFHEIAAAITTSVVSGASIEFGGVAKAVNVDRFTPMEPRFASEVAHAVAGMSRVEANRVVKSLLEMYEEQLADAPTGRTFAECWNRETKLPGPEYIEFYDGMKKKIAELGVPLQPGPYSLTS